MRTVSDAMTRPGPYLHEDDSIERAMEQMRLLGVASLPVLAADRSWKGLVLWDDLDATQRHEQGERIGALARPALALSPRDPVRQALTRLTEHGVGRLPVVEGSRVVGAITRSAARAALDLRATPIRVMPWTPPGPIFTGPMRGHPPGWLWPPMERWEEALEGERSIVSRLASACSRNSLLRRLLRVPADAEDRSLEARTDRLDRVRRSLLGRLFPLPASNETARPHPRPGERPRPGPLLAGEIDAALTLLRDVPFEELQARGWHLQPNHFYWPLNDIDFLRQNPHLWEPDRTPAEIDWDLDAQVQLAGRLAEHAHELDDVPDGPDRDPGQFVWGNTTFPRGDAYYYYGLLRTLAPRRVVEVGSGWSSLVLKRAVEANPSRCEVVLVEPYPPHDVLGPLPDDWMLFPQLIQDVDLDLWGTLEPGDVLFYDGSHCVHTGSDVNWFFFEVLPRLRPGVWIHVHDIQWPSDYSPEWVLHEGLSWNEQYLFQAFLMHNRDYAVRLASSMLLAKRGEEVRQLFPGLPVGGSVWMEKLSS